MNEQKKDNFFLLLKGICILIVILLHSRGGWNFDEWDYFYEPGSYNYTYWLILWQVLKPVVGVFIFMAGYFINQERLLNNPKEFYLKKWKYIVIPFLIWSIIYTINSCILYGVTWSPNLLINVLLGRNGIQLYYVIALLQLFLLAYLLVKYIHLKAVGYICFSISFIYSLVFQYYYMTVMEITWYEMYFFVNWLFYFYLGIYLKKYPTTLARLRTSTIFLLLFVSFIANLLHGFFIQNWTNCATVVASQIGPTNLIYTAMVCICLFYFREKVNKHCTNKFLLFIGGQCYFFFLSHWFFQQYIRVFTGDNAYLTRSMFLCQCVDVAITVLCCTIAWWIIHIIQKHIS